MDFNKFLELVKFSEIISEKIKKSYLEKTFKIVNWKDERDFATEVDEKMEIEVSEKIQELFPDHWIDWEEKIKIKLDAENIWYIDPIDWTKYFASWMPLFTLSIWLRQNWKAIAWIIINPVTWECIYSMKWFWWFKSINWNIEKLENIQTEKDLKKSFIYADMANLQDFSELKQDKWLDFLSKLFKNTYRVRNLWSSCFMSFWWVSWHLWAFIDVFWKTKPQDIAAFSAILQELWYEERYFEIEWMRNYMIWDSDILDQIEKLV